MRGQFSHVSPAFHVGTVVGLSLTEPEQVLVPCRSSKSPREADVPPRTPTHRKPQEIPRVDGAVISRGKNAMNHCLYARDRLSGMVKNSERDGFKLARRMTLFKQGRGTNPYIEGVCSTSSARSQGKTGAC
jgi:hypothetical protein